MQFQLLFGLFALMELEFLLEYLELRLELALGGDGGLALGVDGLDLLVEAVQVLVFLG